MLVLTRKTQEQIHIGDNITISILKLKGNTVRIGIEAPRDVRVLRGELPTFDGTLDVEVAASPTDEDESESSDEETTVSELEWKVLKKIAGRRKPCLPVRRCSPLQHGVASQSSGKRGAPHEASPVAVNE